LEPIRGVKATSKITAYFSDVIGVNPSFFKYRNVKIEKDQQRDT
jgi:hypothetical protein